MAGAVGLGTIAQVKETNHPDLAIIGVDVDAKFTPGVVTGTLANNGVDIGDFNDWDSRVTEQVKTKLAEYRQKIISGTQSVSPANT